MVKKERARITEAEAQELFDMTQGFLENYDWMMITDVGTWELDGLRLMEMWTNEAGQNYSYQESSVQGSF